MTLVKDLFGTYIKNKQYFIELLKIELRIRKRESSLGVFWKIILGLIIITVFGIIFNKGFYKESNYLVYLAMNYYLWQFIQDTLNDAPTTFATHKNILENNNISPLIFMIKNVCISFYVYLFSCLIITLLIVYFNLITFKIFLSIVAIIFVFINTLLISIIISYLQEKFSDVNSLIKLITLLLFLSTPIIWSEKIFNDFSQFLLKLNPLFHFFEIYNSPILNNNLDNQYFISFLVVIVISIINIIVSNTLYKANKFKTITFN